jgi:hypothetical protein
LYPFIALDSHMFIAGRLMTSLRKAAVLAALASCLSAFAVPAAEPSRERPFGGPPPPQRGPDANVKPGDRSMKPTAGTVCKTATASCKLEPPGAPGSPCSCTADGGATTPGTVE